jgi:hypothetical protein
VLNRHFAAKAARVLTGLPPDWDILLWGWNFDSILHVEIVPGVSQAVMGFDPRKLGPKVLEFREKDYDVLPLRLLTAFGLVCYSVSPAGAQRLRERCFPLRNETIPIPVGPRRVTNYNIDVAMNKHYRALRAFVCFPPLAWTENDKATSDIARPGTAGPAEIPPARGVQAGTVAVEVAPGELIDKITILEIKRERIADEGKQAHIRAELAALHAARDRALAASAELARLTAALRAVNEALWQVEDDIRQCERAGDFGPRFVELARSVYLRNDERAALKRQLNALLGAAFSEQKAYTAYP